MAEDAGQDPSVLLGGRSGYPYYSELEENGPNWTGIAPGVRNVHRTQHLALLLRSMASRLQIAQLALDELNFSTRPSSAVLEWQV
jgi:hypothetical protein